MEDYGAAYLFNMLPEKISLKLNNGQTRYIDEISFKEPFTPSYVQYNRSFDDDKPVDHFGTNNKISYKVYRSGEELENICVTLQLLPKDWHTNRDIQLYIYYDCILMRCGGNGERRLLKDPPGFTADTPRSPKNQTVYFFNMTDQRIDLTFNNDEQTIEALSPYPPFTPSMVAFAPYEIDIHIICKLAGSEDAKREFNPQIRGPWDIQKDIQVYVFNDSILIRKEGNSRRWSPK